MAYMIHVHHTHPFHTSCHVTLLGLQSGHVCQHSVTPFSHMHAHMTAGQHSVTPFSHMHAHMTAGQQSEWALKLIVDIARREGFGTLMRGLGPRLIAVPSYMSVFYVVNEELEWHLLNKRLTN